MSDLQIYPQPISALQGLHKGSAVSCLPASSPPTATRDPLYSWFKGITNEFKEFSVYTNVQQLDGRILSLRSNWTPVQERAIAATALDTDWEPYEALVEDYSYISEACAAAPSAPDFTMTEEDRRAYQGLGDYFYDLDVDYDEE